ncbi:amino acid ABC transporter permease [Nonomuraea sediminis]|uniref:amino acid ABC transporter permease n=1 Tax=Nonomuraea sediminis TaxID=2835864 RepID=UPI001BDD56FA|nr:amino acid ABC transporter permease [Nonomuraea sediminis]
MPPSTDVRIRPVRHHGRLVAAALAAFFLAGLLWSLARNPNIHWAVVGKYLLKDLTLQGVGVTVYLAAISMVIGLAGGVVVAVMRLSRNPVLSSLAWLFIWIFRGTPVLVQIIFWGFLGAFYKQISIGIPFTDLTFWSADTNSLVTPMVAALLALGLNEMAYSAEIIRAGILSVDEGQYEAAHSLGMTPGQTLRRIILPQAMRMIIPPMGSETIMMLKTTALVSVIAGSDLLTNLQQVYAQNFEVIPLLIVASIWYLAMTSLLSIPQYYLERRYGKGRSRT